MKRNEEMVDHLPEYQQPSNYGQHQNPMMQPLNNGQYQNPMIRQSLYVHPRMSIGPNQQQYHQQDSMDDQHSKMNYPNQINYHEHMFQFTRKLDDKFLQRLGDDYVCSICLQN